MEQLETCIQKVVCDMEAIKEILSFIYFCVLNSEMTERKEEETVFYLLMKVNEGNLGRLHTTQDQKENHTSGC